MSERRGGPSGVARACAAVLVTAALVAACGGAGEQPPAAGPSPTGAAEPRPTTVPVATTPATPATAPAATAATAGPTTSTPPATASATTASPDAAAAALVTWQRAVVAVAAGGTDPALAAADADVLRALAAALVPPLTFATTATVGPDGSVLVDDCVLGTEAELGARRVRATVTPAGGVTAVIAPPVGGGCIPSIVNAAVLDAYAAFWDAFAQFGAPADPDHPRLAATTTGAYTGVLRAVLARFAADGREFRGRPQLRPEVEAYLAPDRVRIGDCQIMPASFGVYVAATGERTADWPPVRDGQTDFRSVTLRLVDGVWKVEGVRDETDSPCPYPSPRAAAVVGPTA